MIASFIGFVVDRETDLLVDFSDWRELNKGKIAKKNPVWFFLIELS